MSTVPKRELHLFFATENDSAVILRRGARNLWQLIGWDRSDNSFTPGQWIKRRVLAESCCLSPDGRHFMYSVYDGRDPMGIGDVYTVVSRPPYFTALALFAHHTIWNGQGGRFLGNGHFLVETTQANRFDPVPEVKQVVRGKVTKDCRTGLRLLNGQPAPLSQALRAELLEGLEPRASHLLDLYDTQGGRLYRRDGMALDLIADFGPPVFEPVVAPYAVADDTPDFDQGWHPLDGDRS